MLVELENEMESEIEIGQHIWRNCRMIDVTKIYPIIF